MNKITLYANAKINLGLDVIGKRPNGYHDVRMIMQTVKLHDILTLKKIRRKGIFIKTNLHFLPTNENNLIYAAIKLFMNEYHIEGGVHVTLEKKIPVAAGMAGGSTDAAAALHGMNQLYETYLPLEKLQEMGVKLGADVPYCLLGGTALSEGIGEILTPLPPAPACYCLIVKPRFAISTKYVYENLALSELTEHPDIDALISAIEKEDLMMLSSSLGNVLETVSVKEHPELADIKATMISFGALGSLMSGSGPTVFGLFDDQSKANAAFMHFKVGPYGKQSFLTGFFQPG